MYYYYLSNNNLLNFLSEGKYIEYWMVVINE